MTLARGLLVVLAACSLPAVAAAQVPHARPWAAYVVVPQTRPAVVAKGGVKTTEVEAGVVIAEQVATTTLDITLTNETNSRQLAELLVPVPEGAVVRSFTFQGAASEPTAELLKKADAKSAFDSIVSKLRDPALLEFAGYNLIRTSVFPVEPKGGQKVRLTYEHLLTADGDRVDYVLPRSESVLYDTPWKVSVKIKAKRPISTVYSPSHKIETTRSGEAAVAVRLAAGAEREPGAFRLSYLHESGPVTASLLAFPDAKSDGGYFLLLAGLAPPSAEGKSSIKRELTLVLDRSGSMNGEKIAQAKEAALQVLSGLNDGESFNVIVYNDAVDSFSPQPVIKSEYTMSAAREFIKAINALGGTNIHDALLESLRPKPAEGSLPIVLFLTDGLATVGQTSEEAIRNVATKANTHQRRIFTFGVGVDVNTPLLDKIAVETRAFSTFVLPKEDVEVKVGRVFKGLNGPVLASPELRITRPDGEPALGRVRDLLPSKLPDLFRGDQLVLLGRYTGTEPLNFVLKGNHLGEPRQFKFGFTLDGATTKNAFVPRLWASRKIAVLTDQIRDLGATTGAYQTADSNPRLKELTDEIVRLSTEFGILTEYTAFLAREGTDLTKKDDVLAEAKRNFEYRAVHTRSGTASVNQELNNDFQRNQMCLNPSNAYWNAKLERVSITTVQQVNDQAFYRRGTNWVDSKLVKNYSAIKPSKVVEFGSEEFTKLMWRLVKEGRQSCLAQDGDILLEVDGEPVLIKGPQDVAAK